MSTDPLVMRRLKGFSIVVQISDDECPLVVDASSIVPWDNPESLMEEVSSFVVEIIRKNQECDKNLNNIHKIVIELEAG